MSLKIFISLNHDWIFPILLFDLKRRKEIITGRATTTDWFSFIFLFQFRTLPTNCPRSMSSTRMTFKTWSRIFAGKAPTSEPTGKMQEGNFDCRITFLLDVHQHKQRKRKSGRN